jgi:hypothetical protein
MLTLGYCSDELNVLAIVLVDLPNEFHFLLFDRITVSNSIMVAKTLEPPGSVIVCNANMSIN